MGPANKRRRLLPSTPLGFSPFLRSISRLSPVPRCTSSIPPTTGPSSSLPVKSAKPRRPPLPHEIDESSDGGEDDDDKEEEEEDSDDDDEEQAGTVQINLGFFDPKPSDFHGVKLLLQNYLDDRPWDLSGFIDIIVEQTTVGSVVKSDNGGEGEDGNKVDDDGSYAVISALNLGRYATHQCIEELKEYVLSSCPEEALKVKLRSLLGEQAHDVGLLVCERFVNFPYQPVVPLYNGLFDEVEWATEDEPTQELRDYFQFKFYLLIAGIYMNKNSIQGQTTAKASSVKKKKSATKQNDEDEPVVYIKAEDEIFHKLSSLHFTFDLHSGQQRVPPEMKNYKRMGLVMVVESKKVPTFRRELNHIIET